MSTTENNYDVRCDLCAGEAGPEDWNEAAGLVICARCIEDELNAPAVEPRAEVGLVGGRD